MVEISNPARRRLLGVGATTLSSAALVALLGSGAACASPRRNDAAQDANLLNAAIALEHEGIAAYQIGAESGLVTPEVLPVAVKFQGHHKQHRDELMRAVRTLGGAPVEAKPQAEYATALNVSALQNQADVLRLALRLERGAANAYLGLIPSLSATSYHLLAARLAGDEAFHAAVLGGALGEAIPDASLMFGA